MREHKYFVYIVSSRVRQRCTSDARETSIAGDLEHKRGEIEGFAAKDACTRLDQLALMM